MQSANWAKVAFIQPSSCQRVGRKFGKAELGAQESAPSLPSASSQALTPDSHWLRFEMKVKPIS